MKKKQKRLEPVIKYREQVEHDFQKECNRMREVLRFEEDKLSSLEIAQEKSIIELQEKQDLDISLSEASMYYSFLNSVTIEISKQKDLLSQLQEQFEDKRRLLLGAHQDKKVLEILKSKLRESEQKSEAMQEMKFLDEVSEQGCRKRSLEKKRRKNA